MQALTNYCFEGDLLMTYSRCGLFRKPKSIVLSTSRTLSTQPLSLHPKCHQNILFSLTLKFLKDHDSFKVKYLMFKHIHKPTETFQYTHFSSCHPLGVKKGFVKGEALCLLQTNSVKESFDWKKKKFKTCLIIRTRLRSETRRNNPSQSSFRITQNDFTK